MHCKSVSYILRTARLLQSCHCVLGVRIPSRSGLRLLHEIKPWTSASISSPTTVRFLSQEISKSAEEKMTASVNSDLSSSDQDHVHVLHDEYSLEKTDKDHSLDGEKTKFQSTDPPKKLSWVELLDAFSSNSDSPHELYSTIMDLWNILSNKKLTFSNKKLMSEHPNFCNLCYEVMKSAPSMSNRFLVSSLFVFLSLKVNQNTRLIQTLLNVCQQRLSTLKVDEICMLANCIKTMERNKNVDALHSGLDLLIELRCEAIKDVTTLQRLMAIAPAHLVWKFENKALQMIDQFTIHHCHRMFSILAEINLHSETLMDSCSNKLIDYIDELSCKRIITLAGYCSKLMYINVKLLSAIEDNIMNNIYMWNVWQIAMVLESMAFLHYRCIPLLNYFADKIMEDSQWLRVNNLITVSKVFSIVNHLPEGKEDKFLKSLDTVLHLHMNSMSRKNLLKTVYNFCTLGLVSPSVVSKLLQDKSLISTLEEMEKSYLSHIKLCWLLDLGSKPFLMQDLEEAEATHNHSVLMCHTFLKNYFKDPALYQENMKFPNSYFIDFVLSLDKEQNRLVPTNGIKDFQGSENVSRIAVLCCTANVFTLGSLHPVGKVALKLRHLKLLGFTVVVLPVNQFVMMTEGEKEVFLREKIFQDVSSGQTSMQTTD